MIKKVNRNEFALVCDYCEEVYYDALFSTFQEAIDYKKDSDNGWRTIKDKQGDYCDLCPGCNTSDVIRKLKGVEDV
jgi:hypothetical protein